MGSLKEAVCWHRGADKKIMRCLGVSRRRLQQIISGLKKKKILVEQYSFNETSNETRANVSLKLIKTSADRFRARRVKNKEKVSAHNKKVYLKRKNT